jgi:hypothetical protein
LTFLASIIAVGNDEIELDGPALAGKNSPRGGDSVSLKSLSLMRPNYILRGSLRHSAALKELRDCSQNLLSFSILCAIERT